MAGDLADLARSDVAPVERGEVGPDDHLGEGPLATGVGGIRAWVKSLGVAVGAVQQSKVAIEGEYPAWRQLFTDMFLPQDKYPAMNITSVETADGRDITGRTQDILRMLGATP